MRKLFALLFSLAVCASARAELGPLDDARLGPSAGELRAIVAAAEHDGLPPELLLDKLREGLAKNVPAPRLVAFARQYAQALGHARDLGQPFGIAQDHALIKALVDAQRAGVGDIDAQGLLKSGGRVRALEVLTDLTERGYPPGPAARTVAVVAKEGPASLSQLVARTEKLRASNGATPAEALEAVQHAVAAGLGSQHAGDAWGHDNNVGDDNGRGPDRETSGARGPKSGGVGPPGQNKGSGNGKGKGNGPS